MKLKFEMSPIHPKTYNELRKSVGWSVPSIKQSELALENTLFQCTAIYQGEAIGYIRVVGDGVLCFSVQDLLVISSFQGTTLGVAPKLMGQVFKYLKTNANEHSDIYAMSALGVEPLYEKMGLTIRPNSEFGSGMCIPYNTFEGLKMI
ncbi:GNAT family N-acetyltransferase [Vibrio pectenicida]|uniref:GNAT family N-acetyltransferase n=1 Tax=Vibrio pectenicida TaxID=62763 RepID=UPI003B9CC727